MGTNGPVELCHHRLVADGVTHHYVTAGQGSPLVLLHGFPQTWAAWRPVVDRLASRFRIIVPSLRGLAGTPGPASGYDTGTLAADVRAVVRVEVRNEPITLCGHDLGSHVAFAYALGHRSEVRALVLVGPPPPGTAAMERQWSDPRTWHLAFHAAVDVPLLLITGRERAYLGSFVRSRLLDPGAITPAELEADADAYSAPGALRAALEMYRALRLDADVNRAALASGGRLRMPVYAVGSALTSSVDTLESVLADIADDGHPVLMPKSGHWIPQEAPDDLAEVIARAANGG